MTAAVKRAVWLLPLLLVAGCSKPGSDPGPKHRWFNPNGQEVEAPIPDACTDGEFPPPVDTPPPAPPDGAIPAGWHRAVYTLQVDAVKVDHRAEPPFDLEYCIPVSVHVYATAAGVPGEVVEMDASGVHVHQMPWDGLRNTPWRSVVTVGWDPQTTAPVMNFDLSARFEHGPGLAHAPTPAAGAAVGLFCSIRQGPASFVHQGSVDIFATGPGPGVPRFPHSVYGPFVRCQPPAFSAVPL